MKSRDKIIATTGSNPIEGSHKVLNRPLFTTTSTLVLEQRIAFDGALVAAIVDATDQPDAPAPDAPQQTAESEAVANETQALADALSETAIALDGQQGESTNIVFIDSAVRDPALIAQAVSDGAEVVLLDAGRDGLEQIAEYLKGRSGIESIHIVSHGEAGELRLGNTTVTTDTITGEHADELAIIRATLTDTADILIYGCNFADDLAAVEALAAATGADIAASNDDTGSADLGGDWDLEVKTGAIEAAGIEATQWDGLLAPLSISASAPPTNDTVPIPVGGSTVWTNAGFIGGTAIDLRATVVSADPGIVVLALTIGDDPSLAIDTGGFGFGGSSAGSATIQWEIFEAGTGQTVFAIGAPKFTVSDIDGSGAPNTIETIAPELNGLQSYTVDPASALNITTSSGLLTASGTDDDSIVPGGPLRLSAAITFNWSERSSWDVTYTAERSGDGRIFAHDGDGDFVFVNGVTTTLLGIDLDDNNSTAAGTSYNGSFTEGNAAVPIVDPDVIISQHTALGTNLGSATVTLTNAQAGDVIAVGALPAGITANVNTSVAGEITVTLSGNASVADYETALQAITFENTSNDPDTTDRQIQVSVTNTTFGTSSLAALSTISVAAVNDAPAGADNTIPASEDTPHSFTASDFVFSDTDGNVLQSVFITTLPNAADGVLALNGTPVTAGDEIPAAQIANLVFTPVANLNGNGLGSFTFQVKDDGGTANNGEDTDQSPNTIAFNISAVNDTPTAVDDGPVAISGGTPLNIPVLTADAGVGTAADSDPDGDMLTITHITDPANPGTPLAISLGSTVTLASGTTVTLLADGTLDVTTPLTSTGAETFDYTISDGNGGTDTATVTLDRASGNTPPVAQDDTVPVTEDTPVNGNVLADNGNGADSDADGDTLNVTQFTIAGDVTVYNPGDTATITGVGTLVINANGTYTFTPALNYNGPVPVATYTVEDGNGGTDTADLTLGPVSPVNDAPTADDESVITDEDVPVTIDILDGDTDVDGTIDPASVGIEDPANPGTFVTSLTEAGVGTWTVDTNPGSPTFGQITFTPVLHYNGPVTPITYQVADNDGATTTATVDVALDGVNDAPAANPESFTINEDAGLAANVLSNDSDVDGHPLTVASATVDLDGNGTQDNLPLGTATALTNVAGDPIGDITLLAGGTVTFNPAPNYDGPVPQVTYTIDDANGGTATTTLDITITPINDPPVLDLDADDSSLVIGDGFKNTFTEDGGPVAAIDSDVSITDPDDTDMTQAIIAIGGLADGANEILTIGGTSFPLNAAHVGTVTVSGTTFLIVFTPGAGNVGISSNAGGDMPIADLEALLASVTYENTSQNPTAGDRTLGVSVNDGDVTSNVAVSTITVVPANDAPDAVDDTNSVPEDGPAATGNVISGAGTDTDPEADPLTVTLANQAGNPITIGTPFTVAGGGVLTLNADGSYSFDPGTSYNGLDDGESETETITYTVDDGNGGTDTATLTITITGSNDAPVIIDPSNPGPDPENPIPADPATIIPVQTVDDGQAFTPATPLIDVSDFATDPDGEALTFTTTSTLPTGLTLNPDGTVTGTIDPNASQGGDDPVNNPGVYTIQVTVNDGDDTSTVTLTIDVSNPPPVAVDDVATLDEDAAPATGNVITDPVTGDADTPPDSDPLTVTLANQAGNPITIGTPFTTAGGGVLTLNADGSYSFDPGTSYNGLDDGESETETITYTVDDGNGGTDTATLTITITGSNDAPVIIDPSNPGPDPENPIPADPATIIPVQTVDDGQAFTPATPLVDVSDFATDPDGEPLTFTTTSTLPTGLTLNPDGTVTGTIDPNASQGGDDPVNNPGVYTIQVTVNDGDDTSTVTLTIDVSNPPPVAVDDTATLDEDAVPATGNVITDPVTGDADTAPDSDPLTVTLANQAGNPITIGTPFTVAGGGVLTLNADGSYSFDPGTSYNGLDDGETELETITYTVDDGNGGTDTATLEITVTGSNDAPVIIDPSNPGPDPENPIPADPATIIPVQTVDDGQAFTPATPLVDVSDFAADPDGEPLTFTTTSTLPSGLTLNPDGTVTGTIDPDASQGGDDPVNNPGIYTITVTVGDGDDTSTVTLTIDVSNPPPVAVDDTGTTRQDTPVVLSVLGNDHDTAPDSDPISVIAATSNHGTVTVNGNGTLLFTPTPGFFGTAVITYVISDGNGGTDIAVVKVNVEPQDLVPRAPTPDIFGQGPTDPAQPGQGLSANGAVLDAVNGMLGGPGTLFGPGQSIAGTDLSSNPVVASINGFRSLDGLPALNRLYSLDGTPAFPQNTGPIDTVTGHMDRSAHLTLIGRFGENAGGLWGPDTISGFSLKYGDAANSHEVVTIESLVNNRTLVLQTRPSDSVSHLDIESYEVRTIDGSQLPAWLEQLGPGLFMGEWPADTEQLDLSVTVILKDGTRLTREITVQTPTGEISDLNDGRRAHVVPLFSDQLEARHELASNEVNALAVALAR